MSITRIMLTMVLAATTLLSSPVSAHQSSEGTPVEVDGFPLSLSPDGTLLTGMDAEGRAFCVWEVASLEATCDNNLPDLVEVRSVTWSPDSTAVAFSLGSPNRLIDSDIFVFEVASGELRNLTDDTGADEVSLLTPPEQVVAIDRFPGWSPDSQSLVFARTMWGDDDAPGITLMTIRRDGGKPNELAPFPDTAPLAVVGPMYWQADGTILLSTRHPNPQHETNALWRVDTDGNRTRRLDGATGSGITEPVIADIAADGRSASVYSRLSLLDHLGRPGSDIFFRVDLESGDVMPWEAVSGLAIEDRDVLMAPPVFAPNGGSVAFLSRSPDGTLTVSVLDEAGNITDISTVTYRTGSRPALGTGGVEPSVAWATDGTLLVILVTGGTLLTLTDTDPGASPATSPAANTLTNGHSYKGEKRGTPSAQWEVVPAIATHA